ncbi:MAG: glutamine amidotransferase [Limisphaerales bacterium]
MELIASLTFSAWNWLWPVAGVLALAAALLVWGYFSAPPSTARSLGPILKILGIAALAACLLEPLWSGQRVRPGANLFAVLADNSQSLQIHDSGDPKSRGAQLQTLVAPATSPWQADLAENFEVRRYVFDTRLQSTRDFAELQFEGRGTALATSLRSLRDRFEGRPLAGVLLFTDGNATDIAGSSPDLTGLPPVYPVVIGQPGNTRDLSITQVGVTTSVFEDAPVTLQADIGTSGFSGESVRAQLIDQKGVSVGEQTVDTGRPSATASVRFQYKPEQPGLSFYQLRVGTPQDLNPGLQTNLASAAEATLANNARIVAVNREQGPYRILYVSGRPNWEFKFLKRAVQADREVELVGLIRVARREPKFEFRGRAGETSNPLFRGFGEQSPESVERYDQPVLVRLDTRDELELRNGFPRTPEELFAYHAVILDDVENAFFAPDQAAVLQRFVTERGGGLLMLGGMESFREGGYYRTPIGDMLPVYLDPTRAPTESVPLRFELSRDGWLQSWARLRDTEAEERDRIETMPPFLVANRIRDPKPGASVIASAKDPQGKDVPALAVQRFGRGRTGALLIGDFWRWGMQSPEARADMEKSWRQLVRWLVSDIPKRVEIASEPVPEDPNGAIRIEVRVRDPQFQPADNAAVSIEVEPVAFGAASTNVALALRAEPALSEPGLYEATYIPRTPGGFRARARVLNALGAEEGRAETGWTSDPVAEEFNSLVPNLPLLEEIARKTGGRPVRASDLDAFVRELPTRTAPVMESWSSPAWHTPYLFAFALACLVAEWGLRRVKGLP